jgi:hypothetical protein
MPPPKPPDRRRKPENAEGFQTVQSKRKRDKTEKFAAATGYASDTSTDTNYFATLHNDEDVDNISMASISSRKIHKLKNKNDANNDKKPTEQKLPPITITEININQVFEELEKLQIQKGDFEFTINQAGIKLFIKSLEKYNLIKNRFVEAHIKFYTHSLLENQKIKFVLYGLPDMELDDVKKMLAEKKLNPSDIKKMTIKYKKFDGHCNYLLYFEKSSKIKISDVRQIRALNYCMVKWEYYSKNSVGPTQCSNCQKFGHGANNCFMAPKCLKCSEHHKTQECVYNFIGPSISANEKPQIPKEKIKCSNCSKAHTSNYKGCEERIKYLKRLEAIRNRNQKIQMNRNPSNSYLFQNSPELYNTHFPSIHNNRSLNGPAWKEENTYTQNSKAFKSSPVNHYNDDLFSPSQCMEIFNEFLEKLNNCHNKKDQLQVMAEITFKYLSK